MHQNRRVFGRSSSPNTAGRAYSAPLDFVEREMAKGKWERLGAWNGMDGKEREEKGEGRGDEFRGSFAFCVIVFRGNTRRCLCTTPTLPYTPTLHDTTAGAEAAAIAVV